MNEFLTQAQPLVIATVIGGLNVLGKFLKNSKVDDELIPLILGLSGAIVGYTLYHDVNAVTFGLASVGLHQVVRQTKKGKEYDGTKK